jgi:hypothetical protein
MRVHKPLLAIAATQLAAILLGAGAAIAFSHQTAAVERVFAATHCTRYAPPTNPDTNCHVNGTIDATYLTSSFAWRDSNAISMADTRSWTLWYAMQDGSSVDTTGGSGFGGVIGSYGGAQVKSVCDENFSAVTGHCVTDWHD